MLEYPGFVRFLKMSNGKECREEESDGIEGDVWYHLIFNSFGGAH